MNSYTNKRQRVLVVGSSGPLSKLLIDHLNNLGESVISIGRFVSDVRNRPNSDYLPREGSLSEACTVVFLAWPTQDRTWAVQSHFCDVVETWSKKCQDLRARFIFISTTQASDTALSSYGRAKQLAEMHVLATGGIVLRVGLVVDDSLETLATRVRHSKLFGAALPFIGSVPIEPVSSSDLLQAISQILYQSSPDLQKFACFQPTVCLSTIRNPNQTCSPRVSRVLRLLALLISKSPEVLRVKPEVDGMIGLLTRSENSNRENLLHYVNLSQRLWYEHCSTRNTQFEL